MRGEKPSTIAAALVTRELREQPTTPAKARYLSWVLGFSVSAISKYYNVHKSTASRWISNVTVSARAGRPALLAETQSIELEQQVRDKALKHKPMSLDDICQAVRLLAILCNPVSL